MRRNLAAGRAVVALAAGAALMVAMADVRGDGAAVAAQATRPIPADLAGLRDVVAGLDRRVAELERKVEELERKGLEALKAAEDANVQDARMKTLEQRLATVEKSQAGETAGTGRTGKPAAGGSDEPTTVQAPFVVRDGNRVIFRVDVPPDTQGRLVIGNPVGARVVLGMTKDETPNVVLYSRDNRLRAAILGDSESPQLLIATPSGTANLLMTKGGGTLQFSNNTSPIVTLGLSDAGNGRLQLSDAAGTTMVEAGTNASGFGVVRVGPQYGGTLGNLTIPWQIVGRKAK